MLLAAWSVVHVMVADDEVTPLELTFDMDGPLPVTNVWSVDAPVPYAFADVHLK